MLSNEPKIYSIRWPEAPPPPKKRALKHKVSKT